MLAEDQSAVVAFLQAASAPDGPRNAVETITTHISKVFLAGGRAFKLKRAVRFPYVDFSSAALRHAACLRELELNRRTAPDLYLAVRRITRDEAGALVFDGDGPLIDAVVEMRRFDQSLLLDALALRGALTGQMIAGLAHRVALFHAAAEVARDKGGVDGMKAVLEINERSLNASGLICQTSADLISRRFDAALAQHGDLLERRRAAGKVRRCHGDLILRNICLLDGVPTLFDCLEFNEDLATIDVLYDAAFLIMDLLHRKLAGHANAFFNRYLDETGDSGGMSLIPFFIAVRAAVRAHVMAAQAQELPAAGAAPVKREAKEYLSLASALLSEPRPRLVAIGGRSGAGKSTVAAALAPLIGLAPGARVLSSDRIRKRLHGVRPEERLPDAAYAPEVSRQVFALMRDEARRALQAGAAVIADAVHDRPEDRAAIEAIARETGTRFDGVWLEAPADVMKHRIALRRHDPSDATPAILELQLQQNEGEINWLRIAAGGQISTVVADAAAALSRASVNLAALAQGPQTASN